MALLFENKANGLERARGCFSALSGDRSLKGARSRKPSGTKSGDSRGDASGASWANDSQQYGNCFPRRDEWNATFSQGGLEIDL
jgi:hypothetical protein